MECKMYNISGRVQGVGFRFSAFSKARELKIFGTVKNMPDGTVQLFACGDSWQLGELEKWLYSGGPIFAKITHIDREVVPTEELPQNFAIL